MQFLPRLASILNTNQSRSLILTGNVYDLFWNDKSYIPLVNYLSQKLFQETQLKKRGLLPIIYEVNKPITINSLADKTIRGIWGDDGDFDKRCGQAAGNPTLALEFLRQLVLRCRKDYDILVIVEGADMILPEAEISRMSPDDRHRVAIVHDWFSDPEFCNGTSSVVLISESKSLIHSRIAKLPQVLSLNIPYPDLDCRREFLQRTGYKRPEIGLEVLAKTTAALTLHALRQLTCEVDLGAKRVVQKIEEFVIGQLGEGVVEFKQPTVSFEDVIGFKKVKRFMLDEMEPRMLTTNKKLALVGAIIAGPIGGGKTFLCEALAANLNCPVLVLKNIRSQWYGQTDVMIERLIQVLEALEKVVIFLDEADTQFGGVGSETHETERRLTGKIQALMSDPRFKGKVFWLMMTARINQLSPDIRRPGRGGDLIVPILDPEDGDREDFVKWVLGDLLKTAATPDTVIWGEFNRLTKTYSAASFASLKMEIDAKKDVGKCQTIGDALIIARDIRSPDINTTREYQALQAKLNCTRNSLLFDDKLDDKSREELVRSWETRCKELEANGV